MTTGVLWMRPMAINPFTAGSRATSSILYAIERYSPSRRYLPGGMLEVRIAVCQNPLLARPEIGEVVEFSERRIVQRMHDARGTPGRLGIRRAASLGRDRGGEAGLACSHEVSEVIRKIHTSATGRERQGNGDRLSYSIRTAFKRNMQRCQVVCYAIPASGVAATRE
jgi:hypothetical protein